MKTILSFFVILFSLCSSLQPASAASAGSDPGKTGTTSVFSSPELYPLTMKWAAEYSRLFPDRQIKVMKAEGAELTGLAGKSGRLGFISGNNASIPDREAGWQVVVGRDVIVPVVNAANPLLAEIVKNGVSARAFAASIDNPGKQEWGTLLRNGSTDPIHYYIVKDPATRSQLGIFLDSDPGKRGNLQTVPGEEIAEVVGLDPYAIGFCRLTDILAPEGRELAGNIRLLPIDKNGNGKLDYMEQIYDNVQAFSRGVWIGKYPKTLTCNIFAVTSAQSASESEAAFLAWVITDGQQLMNYYGYCTLFINERQSQLDKIYPADIASTPALQTTSYQQFILWGVVAILAVGFILDRLGKQIRKRQSAAGMKVSAIPAGFGERTIDVPKGIYFDKTHTWAFMEKDGIVKAGIDDFLRHVTGPVTRVEMKNSGDRISKGDPFLTIIQQGKKLVLYSPVSGRIKTHNRELAANPSLLNTSPCSDGWVYQIEPANWIREIQFLSMAESYRLWLTGEFSRLKDFLAVALRADDSQYAHVVLQDGGDLKESLLSELSPEVWEDFQTKFLDACK